MSLLLASPNPLGEWRTFWMDPRGWYQGGCWFVLFFHLWYVRLHEYRLWELLSYLTLCDFTISRLKICDFTNHECISFHEFTKQKINFHDFTNHFFPFHESRTTPLSRFHERFFSFSRFHERKKTFSRLHEPPWGGLLQISEISMDFYDF